MATAANQIGRVTQVMGAVVEHRPTVPATLRRRFGHIGHDNTSSAAELS